MAMSYMSAICDPMVYPLIFPCSEPGWHNELSYVEAYKTPKHNKVTMLQFYTYRLAVWKLFNPIHHCKKLFQQYLVDAYVKTESQRLDYI